MNKKRCFLRLFLTSFLFVMCGAFFCVGALPAHTDEFYVNDFVRILSQDTKTYIVDHSRALDNSTSAQVVVAVVESLEDKDVNDYALDLFRKWGIGAKGKDNGLLILLAPNERKISVEVGYGLEGKINDSKAGRFIDEYAVPYFKNDKWDEGVKMLYTALISEVYSEYGMERPEEVSSALSGYSQTYENSESSIIMAFIIFALIFVFGGILPWIFRKKRFKSNHYNDHDDFGGFGGFGGGSWGSGGGGFGGFGGGGGSSGGGGASRGF